MAKDNQDNDKNIVSFPEKKQRKAIEKAKKRESKEQGALEERYREQYRREQRARNGAQNAMRMGNNARNTARGKQPFMNWEKIPLFSRILLGMMIGVHIFTSIILDSGQLISAYYYLGFTPGTYTGAAPFHIWAVMNPITSLALHGSWMHLIFNCVMALIMGIFFERQYGSKACAIFFILCGLGGNLFYLLINPFSTAPVIGASGAISGLFAVTFMTIISSGMAGPEAQKRGPAAFILLWSAIIIATGILGKDISWQSHLGGFYSGIGLYYLWKRGTIKI